MPCTCAAATTQEPRSAGKVTRQSGYLHFRVGSTDQVLSIREDHGMVDGLGGQVWDGCFALCDHLERLQLRGKRVLELGCGAGLSGLLCACLGADVLLTDEFPDLAAENARRCREQHGVACAVAALRWGAQEPVPQELAGEAAQFDYVIGAEVTPLRGVQAVLVETIVRFASSSRTKVLLTFDGDARELEGLTTTQRAFVQRMEAAGYEHEVVHVCELGALPHYKELLTAPVGDKTSVVQFALRPDREAKAS